MADKSTLQWATERADLHRLTDAIPVVPPDTTSIGAHYQPCPKCGIVVSQCNYLAHITGCEALRL